MPRSPILAALAGLALAGCNQTSAPGPSAATPGVTPSGFAMPAGSGCTGEIGRYKAVVDNDLATGHVNRSVHARIAAELDRASASCAAGRDAEAVRMVTATKSRYGY
jgi:hypothetical protein